MGLAGSGPAWVATSDRESSPKRTGTASGRGKADMQLKMVSIPTDNHALDGLLYAPDAGPREAAMFFHGNCMNFYTGPARMVPSVLNACGYACLCFNRRGHDMIASLNSREVVGGAFQMTQEAIADNRYAAQWLCENGYQHPLVIGHSNGGMLAVQHVADHPATPALILLSAHLGGRSIVRLASQAGLLGRDHSVQVENKARQMVAEGRGRELMFMPGWWYVITAESYLDYCSNLPDVLALAPDIKCPVLYIRGDREPANIYPAEEFARRAGGQCDVRIVEDCDHFYTGREAAVSEIMMHWLSALAF
jgi:pimeloyl-ACP methyl ester carboxylesterase